ncbi:MAG TPA: HD domain-containing phosphohydrolase [Gemmatirosa sp.]
MPTQSHPILTVPAPSRVSHVAMRAVPDESPSDRRREPSPELLPERLVSLSDVLAALSHALDLTSDQPVGHTLRSCLIAGRLAGELGLGAGDRGALHYAVLLKDAGCSSNASRFAALFGTDDAWAKRRMKEGDWQSTVGTVVRSLGTVGAGRSFGVRVRAAVTLARTHEPAREIVAIRCDRGAEIARMIGFPDATADAIRALDEHWNGGGYPDGLRGDAIPLLAQIANLAQTVELFHTKWASTGGVAAGIAAVCRVVRARRGTWFAPALADRVLGWSGDASWWQALDTPDTAAAAAAVSALEPDTATRQVDEAGLDVVARAFAEIIDAKSPYTFRHSTNVAAIAVGIAGVSGLDAAAQRRLGRAGLLHDVGKLGVSNQILDSPARLGPEERMAVERHPRYTWEVLSRVGAFTEFAWTAATHHEKLDGSGYPWGLLGDALDGPARILAVADIYEALTADRPYRAGMTPAAALAIIARDRGPKLCAAAVDALAAWVERAGDGTAPVRNHAA